MKKPVLRRCTGCMQMVDKRFLIRIVFNKEGGIAPDPTGKAAGRGAYLCEDAECVAKAAKNRGLERSFKCAVPGEVYAQLKESFGGRS